MVKNDLMYVQRLVTQNVLKGPVLELGAGYGGMDCKDVIRAAGLYYYSTDLHTSQNVDFTADLTKKHDLQVFANVAPFGSILVLNVLEHTFDPVAVLDNCLEILISGGVLIVLTPCIWPLHDYPVDTFRLNPNFYEQYSLQRDLQLEEEYFQYVGVGRVRDFRGSEGGYRYPPPAQSIFYNVYSKVVHELTHTMGRKMRFPGRLAIAAVFRKK
jgi:SAM-dependent methyltransferase